jgi:multidrug efflux pump subunit AcrB
MAHESDDELIKNTHNLARFFTEQHQVAWVCLAVVLFAGIYGANQMPQRKDPDVPARTAEVIVPWRGTAPAQIEQLVTKRVEQAIAQNQWATEIKSTVRTGVTTIQFELEEKAKYNTSNELDDIKQKLDAIHDLPKGAGPINYIKDFGDTTALMLTVASPPADPQEVAWRSKLVEAGIRKVRASATGDGGQRVSVVVAYPTSMTASEVERPAALIGRELVNQKVVRDLKPLSGAGFAGFDFATDLNDNDLRTRLEQLVQEKLQTDEIHPDASGAAVIRDPAQTQAVLQSVAGDKYTYRDLDDFTETIQRSVKTVPLVSKVDLSGVLEQKILLNYSQYRLAQYKLKPADITDMVKARNLNDTGGTFNTPGRSLDVTTTGEFKTPQDLNSVIIGESSKGAPLYLRDLVDIERGYENPPSFLSHYMRRDANGKWLRTRAVTVSIQMRKNQQIGTFGKLIDANLDVIRKTLPSDLVLARTSDQPLQVKDSVELFTNSLIEALVLVVIVSWIGFWSWRTALLMAAAVPITLALTFGVIHAIGIDLQQVSIASLIIALGLLVDVPVVSGDAIERELAEGREKTIAAWLGPTKLFRTMAFATLTNVVAYLPFLLLPGDTGKFLYSLPIVIGVSLASALLVSMTFVPLISAFLLKGKKETPIEERRKQGFTGWYFRTATKGIKHRKACLAVSLLLILAGGLIFTTLKTQFFPKDLQYFSYIDIWLPEDSPLSATKQTTQEVETIVQRVAAKYGEDHKEHGKAKDVLQSMTAFMGGGGPRFWSSATPEDKQTNYAEVILRTTDKHDTTPLLDLLQLELDKEVPGAIIDTRALETGSPVGIPVQIRVSGEDLVRLSIEGATLEQILRNVPIARRVRSDWGDPSLKLSVDVNTDRASLAKVTNSDVSNAVQGALQGIQAGTYREGEKQIAILGKLRMEEASQLSDLHNLYVFSSQQKSNVPLQQVASIDLKPTIPKIKRFDQYRTITVQCWPAEGHLPSEVISAALPKLKEFEKQLPAGFTFRYAGEQKSQVSGFGDLATVLVICILCIYLALLAQFKNAVKPLIVFAAIPYGIVGAVTALAIMGEPFGFMAFLGVISLIGIIVSHIIVLFEFIEERREAGEELELALIDAGILRLRPVLITVAATVFALIPLAIHGGPLWQGLCYAQIGGLTIATFITLGLVPILYSFVVLDLKWVAWGEKKEGRGENGGKDSGGASDPNTQTQSQQRPQQQRPSESHA